jgi:hypothetical protein
LQPRHQEPHSNSAKLKHWKLLLAIKFLDLMESINLDFRKFALFQEMPRLPRQFALISSLITKCGRTAGREHFARRVQCVLRIDRQQRRQANDAAVALTPRFN